MLPAGEEVEPDGGRKGGDGDSWADLGPWGEEATDPGEAGEEQWSWRWGKEISFGSGRDPGLAPEPGAWEVLVVLCSAEPKGLVKGVASGTLEQGLFWECAEGIFFSFCLLGRTSYSHFLVYGILGGWLSED